MNRKSILGELTPSICEAAFDEYSKLDDSLSEQIRHNEIAVRDFIILSFICDQRELTPSQLAHILGLNLDETHERIQHLVTGGLVEFCRRSGADGSVRLTDDGEQMTLRIHMNRG